MGRGRPLGALLGPYWPFALAGVSGFAAVTGPLGPSGTVREGKGALLRQKGQEALEALQASREGPSPFGPFDPVPVLGVPVERVAA